MKKSDIYRPLTPFMRRIDEYRNAVHGPVRIRNYRRADVRDFFYGQARQANFSQFDSEYYPNNGFSKAQLDNSLSNLEKHIFVEWVQEGMIKSLNKKKPIKDRALSSIFSMDGLLNAKPKEILKQIRNSSIFGYGFVQISKNVVNVASELAEINFSRYTRLSEDYMANNSMSLVKSAVSQAAGFVSSAISGVMAGSAVGGPLGAMIGASINVAAYGVKSWVQTKEAESKFYQTLNASKSQSAFSLQRAGLTDGGRGTEN